MRTANDVKRTFASDNYSGVHPQIMEALERANQGHMASYGADPFTAAATEKFKALFGKQAAVFFVYNGTGANVTALSALTRSWEAVICSHLAHINVDESTAPEKFTGCKLLTISSNDGKIYPADIEACVRRRGDQHHPQARVVSISQTTEYATTYTVDEIRAIAAVARRHGLYLHMDGARIANAAAALKLDFAEFTRDAGVDVLSFGGTKNGLMFGEAVVFLRPELAANFPYIRKQSMQLHSKMRFVAAQFDRLLSNGLWHDNAAHANRMATLLAEELRRHPQVKITQHVDANGVFAWIPPDVVPALQEAFDFYVWDEKTGEVRLMCSYDTAEEDVRAFGRLLASLLAARA